MTSRAEPDRRRYHDEAGTLLSKAVWTTGDVDQAVLMHDLLETPEGTPDPVAKKLRDRLTGELERRLALAENPADRIRHQFFSSRLLDVRDAFARRLFLWFYLGVTRFADYQSGARGQLDAAADAFLELDRMIRAQEPRAAALLGGNYDSVLLGFAAACYVRYGDRRELLQGDLPPGREREIRADLDHAIDASQRVAGNSGSPARAEGLAALGSCYACRYEDDARYRGRETIDEAIALLRDALRLAEATAGR